MPNRLVSSGAILVLLVVAATADAQWVDPDTCSWADASCQQANQERSDAQWQERQDAQEKAQAETDSATKARRAELLALPPLPPDRNPLLGRWQVAADTSPRAGDGLAQVLAMFTDMTTACGAVFGGGVTEFKPGSWAANDGAGDDSRGAIQYRIQGGQVFALPEQGAMLLGFDIVDKSTIREIRLPDCTLVRVRSPAASPVANVTTVPGDVRPAAAGSSLPPASATTSSAAARRTREPIEPTSRLGRGVQLHGQREFQQALQQLLAAAQSDPDDPRVYVYLADTYGWLGMNAEANQAAERAEQLDPEAFEILRAR